MNDNARVAMFRPTDLADLLYDAWTASDEQEIPPHVARAWVALEHTDPEVARQAAAMYDDDHLARLTDAKLAAVEAAMLELAGVTR